MSCTPQTYGGKTCYTKSTTACDSNQKCENGQCVSKCNTANNQYADERECDEDWHQWWKCYKNNSSGCWYPTCNEDDDYYTDQQTCEIETGKNCEVESATANYIVCYTPVKFALICNGGYTSESACESAIGSYAYNHKCYGPYSGCYYIYCDEENGYYDDEQTCDIETGGPCEERGHCFEKSSGDSGGSDCGCDCDVGVPYVGQSCDYVDANYGHDSCTGWHCDCCINPH